MELGLGANEGTDGGQEFTYAPILAAADSTGAAYNAMTIGWGEVGTLWGQTARL